MITLAGQRNATEWSAEEWREAANHLPAAFVEDLGRYRRWQDQQAALIGKRLLGQLTEQLLGERVTPDRLETDRYRRPYLPGVPDFDFNISHTEGLVLCCAALGRGRVGVDVEQKKPVDITEFRRVFTAAEYDRLAALDDPTEMFYRLWTRKEAVMKADGRGFYLDAATIDCLRDPVVIAGTDYRVVPLELPEGFAGHVAAVGPDPIGLFSCPDSCRGRKSE